MIPWVALLTASAWVDFAVMVLSKLFPLTKTLGEWYREFGVVAPAADILILVLGIALAKFLVPSATGWTLVGVSVAIQLVHDVLFYLFFRSVPDGHNKILDLFKKYAGEGGFNILLADAGMIAASVLLMEALDNSLTDDQIAFAGLLAVYSLLFILFTR